MTLRPLLYNIIPWYQLRYMSSSSSALVYTGLPGVDVVLGTF
jgi:hypothetical protein